MLEVHSRPAAFVFFASIAIGLMLFNALHVAAQAQQTQVISLGKIFDLDLAELEPNEKLKALADQARLEPPECPDAFAFRIVVRPGDPIFADTLAKAREESLGDYLDKNYGLKVGRNFIFAKYATAAAEDVQAKYSGPEPLKLDTQFSPSPGTWVKTGQAITATMTASDDADKAQGGLRSITLIDMQKNGIVPDPWYAETAGVAKCTDAARKPPVVQARYVVPANPPALIVLEAVAEDFAGKVERDLGVFPTGDWYGTMKLKREVENYQHTITWRFSVSDIPNTGEVRGTALVAIDYSTNSKSGECRYSHNILPARAMLNVKGRRIGERLIIDFPDPGVTYSVRQICARGLDQTEHRPFVDIEASFDIGGIAPGAKYPLRFEVPPTSQENRVTTTMELFRAKPVR